MDTGTGLAILGSVAGSVKLVEKILGPTADYLGEGIRDWTQKGARNIGKIFENAGRKLGDRIESPGKVPPRVLKGILSEGYFCDDEIGAEYFGGVLASSRTSVSRDDRGCTMLSMIGRMSAYQLRAHYIFYNIAKRLLGSGGYNIGLEEVRRELQILVPWRDFVSAMKFSKDEQRTVILRHIMDGLEKEMLIGNFETWAYGASNFLESRFQEKIEDTGVTFCISALGVELYLWSHGLGGNKILGFCDPAFEADLQPVFDIPFNATLPKSARKKDDPFWFYGNSLPKD
jgi:hypothetical protein